MKVKIIKCKSKTSWYAGMVGGIFEVIKHDNEYYKLKEDQYKNVSRLIIIDETEIIKKK